MSETVIVHDDDEHDEPDGDEHVEEVADALEDIADVLEDAEEREERDDAVEHALRHERDESELSEHRVNGQHLSREEVAGIATEQVIAILEDLLAEIEAEETVTEQTEEVPADTTEQVEEVEDVTVPPEIEERATHGTVPARSRNERRLRMGGRHR